MALFDRIIAARGLRGDALQNFLSPDYNQGHDPFLLPDMKRAVERLISARDSQEHITIYGDYDIDGLTASTLLVDAFKQFGFKYVDVFIPNRFVEGYGMTKDAVERIARTKTTLIVTVDCGSLSEREIVYAKEKGIDVIVTDHHNVAPEQPPAVAVVNPKRLLQDHPELYEGFVLKDVARDTKDREESASAMILGEVSTLTSPALYPFLDLPGVGVAFKLVQALQTRLSGIDEGQEKWLLDLVALGTVCDVVTLQDENRMHVYWGLEVMKKTRRPGLRALMAVAGVESEKLNARSLGFALGPRMNAAGRLETAKYSQDMLLESDGMGALKLARQLDEMNTLRRVEQDKIVKDAIVEAEKYKDDPVLVLSGSGWNHGIVGIVAAKLLEKYKKPTFVLEEMDDEAKGSARSYGDFSAADAIRFADDIISKGGGHKLAAGVTLPVVNIEKFRDRVNKFYFSLGLDRSKEQEKLLPHEDATAELSEITDELVTKIDQLEPYGNGNERPIIKSKNLLVKNTRRMGADGQHLKLELENARSDTLTVVAFNAEPGWFVEPGMCVDVWYEPEINEWRGRRSIQGRLGRIEISDIM